MTDAEQCQHLIALQNSRLERFDRTRSIQWNFNSIFWTGIVVSTAFLATKDNDISIPWYLLIAYGLVLLVVQVMAIRSIQKSLDFDKDKFVEYNMRAELILNIINIDENEIRAKIKKENQKQSKRSLKWILLQLLITIFLLSAGISILL